MEVLELIGVKDLDVPMLQVGFSQIMKEYGIWINGIMAFTILTGILAFIVLFIKLAKNGDKPQERSKVLNELFVVGIITSLAGSFTLVLNLFYSIMIG